MDAPIAPTISPNTRNRRRTDARLAPIARTVPISRAFSKTTISSAPTMLKAATITRIEMTSGTMLCWSSTQAKRPR